MKSIDRLLPNFSKNPWFWAIAIGGLIIDQISKLLVIKTFPEVGVSYPLWEGVFHFTYVVNDGAAFSAFSGGVVWLRWLSLLVSLILIVMGWISPTMDRLEQISYGFILAGASGNGIDRFLFGFVVDFIHVKLINFPVFNLADVFINCGIGVILIGIFFPHNFIGGRKQIK
ncbi:MAG: lipoprotein signal peptidase [Synechococcaceae cyanobacterium RL_1_2]|nr:lipoprotein signal peptidase [Synechococcaceae cyanobacterium RL_1_2]